MDDCDSSSRELARAIGVIDGRGANRMVFRVDRFGRGGNRYPFYKAGIPAVPMFGKNGARSLAVPTEMDANRRGSYSR